MSYDFTLTDGTPLTIVEPLEGNGYGAQSVPRAILDINFDTPNEFIVADDVTSRFTAGFSFTVITGPYDGTYVVDAGGSTYDLATNTTTIPVTASVVAAPLLITGVTTGAGGIWRIEGAINGDCVYYPGATFTVLGSGPGDGLYTVQSSDVSGTYTIADVNTVDDVGPDAWTFGGGDHTDFFTPGTTFKISANNPGGGTYTVVSSSVVGLTTEVVVLEVIPGTATAFGVGTLVPAVTLVTVTGTIPALATGTGTATVPVSVAYPFSSAPTMLANIGPNTYSIIWHLSPSLSVNIDAADNTLDTFDVVGDYTIAFTTGKQFTVSGSAGNNGTYTVVAPGATFSAGFTTIPVVAGTVTVNEPTPTGTGAINYVSETAFTVGCPAIIKNSVVPSSPGRQSIVFTRSSTVTSAVVPGLTGNYDFTVAVDGGLATNYTVALVATDDLTAIAGKMDTVLGVVADAASVGYRMKITSATTGLGSSVAITRPTTGINPDLFNAIGAALVPPATVSTEAAILGAAAEPMFDDLQVTITNAVDNGINTDVTVSFRFLTDPIAPGTSGSLTFPLPPIPHGFIQYDSVPAATSLQLVGRGSPAFNNDITWGHALQNNDIHITEHFNATTPPVAPIQGQLWFNQTTSTLFLFTSTIYNIENVNTSTDVGPDTWTIDGSVDKEGNSLASIDLTTVFTPGVQFAVYNNPGIDAAGSYAPTLLFEVLTSTNAGTGTDTTITISTTPTFTPPFIFIESAIPAEADDFVVPGIAPYGHLYTMTEWHQVAMLDDIFRLDPKAPVRVATTPTTPFTLGVDYTQAGSGPTHILTAVPLGVLSIDGVAAGWFDMDNDGGTRWPGNNIPPVPIYAANNAVSPDEFVLSGNYVPFFPVGRTFSVSGSAGNDGAYAVTTPTTFSGGLTTIHVANGTIPLTEAPGFGTGSIISPPASRVLVKDASDPSDNGIYAVKNKGSGGTQWELIRSADADDTPALGEVSPGMFTFVETGTENVNSGWTLVTDNPIILEVTGLVFFRFTAISEPDTQIVFGTGPGTPITSSADFTFDDTTDTVLIGAGGNVGTITNSGGGTIEFNTNTLGNIVLTAANLDTIEVGASINITGATATTGSPITITAGSSTTAQGAAVNITGGTGGGVNDGGWITLSSGDAGTTGSGGLLQLLGGDGGTVSGNGGAITLTGGSPALDGNGGGISVSGGIAVGTNRSGGIVSISSGMSTGTATGPQLNLTGGLAGAAGTGTGGAAFLSGGSGGGVSGNGGAVTVRGGTATEGAGGAVNITGRAALGAGANAGGNVVITSGDATTTGAAGIISLVAGVSPAGTDGSIRFTTNAVERLEILGDGSWEIGGTVGTAEQVLASNGAGTPPTWQSASSLINEPANQIVYGTGTGITSEAAFTWNPTTDVLTLGGATSGGLTFTGTGQRIVADFSNATIASRTIFRTGTVNGNTVLEAIPNGTATVAAFVTSNSSTDPANAAFLSHFIDNTVAALSTGIRGTGTPLNIEIRGYDATGAGVAGTNATIRGGLPTDGNGGSALVTGSNGVGTNRSGGNVTLTAGNGTGTGVDGNVLVVAGTGGSGGGGSIRFTTGATERLEILEAGGWEVGGSQGSLGQALVSNGTGTPPTWQAVAAASASSLITSLTNGNAGAITIGRPVYVSAASTVDLADATGGGSPDTALATIGLVFDASIASAASGNIITHGRISNGNWTTATGAATLTTGSTYYLSETTGQITTTAPVTVGSWVIPIGIALSTTDLMVNIGTPIQN